MRDLANKLQSIEDHLRAELSQIRTGRASISLVENILVDAYEGSPRLMVKELAALSAPDFQTIIVAPWDKSLTSKISSAIGSSGGGLNPVVDGDLVKVPVPPLTQERREEMVKMVGKKVEEAKISVRNIRQDAMRSLDEQKENGVISEDEYFRGRGDVDEEVRKVTNDLEELGGIKKEELIRV